MKAEQALTWIRDRTPDATLEQAAAFIALAEDRGLTPFVECHPIFTTKKEKVGGAWTSRKVVSLKEHYNIAARWGQQCGGYSTPVVETTREIRTVREYDENKRGYVNAEKPGVKVRIGVLTNRDYAALIDLAQMRIPGFDFMTERAAFLKWGEAWVADDHSAPSGKDATWVARKRATEEALLNAFGREPSQARQMYQAALTAEAHQDAVAALYPPTPTRAALPATPIIEGDFTPPSPPEPPPFDEDADAEMVAELARQAQAETQADPQAETQADPDLSNYDATPFTTPEAAIQWGMTSGAFTHGQHAKNAYNQLRTAAQPTDARQMAQLWRRDVARRLRAQDAQQQL